MGSSSLELKKTLEIATMAARQGADILLHFWGKLKKIEEKSAGNLVTEADRLSEQKIIEVIKSHFPDHQILAEESGLSSPRSSEYLWAIDPLDGTTNYAHQYPTAAVSIGLIYQNQAILGVIYNPFQGELYCAAKGLGATLNNKAIHVSTTSELSKSLLATGFAYDRNETTDNNYREFCHLTSLTQGVRRAGAASLDLAYVACGRIDGYWERGLKPWDIAAGIILVEEAGGQVSNYNSTPLNFQSGRILATNHHLHSALSQELAIKPLA